MFSFGMFNGPSTLATLFNHMWPRIVAGIFIPVSIGNHYFQALASTLQFVAQVCDRLWLVPATGRAFLWLRSAFGSEHTSDCSCGMWQPLSRVGNFAEYGNFAGE